MIVTVHLGPDFLNPSIIEVCYVTWQIILVVVLHSGRPILTLTGEQKMQEKALFEL